MSSMKGQFPLNKLESSLSLWCSLPLPPAISLSESQDAGQEVDTDSPARLCLTGSLEELRRRAHLHKNAAGPVSGPCVCPRALMDAWVYRACSPSLARPPLHSPLSKAAGPAPQRLQ